MNQVALILQTDNQLGYKIDQAYKNADQYAYGSIKWDFWMNRAKQLENELHGRKV